MSINQKKQNQQESLNTHGLEDSANLNNSNSQLILKEEIEGTPFHVVGNDDHGYFIAFGKYRISNSYPNPDLAIDALHESDKWHIITNLLSIFAEFATLDALKKIDERQGKLDL